MWDNKEPSRKIKIMCSELMFNDNNKNVLSKNIKLFQKSPAVLKQCFFSAPVKVIKNPQPEVRQLSKPYTIANLQTEKEKILRT